MGIMIEYWDLLKDQENEESVEEILESIFGQDSLSEQDMKRNLEDLEVIKAMGEDKIYDKAVADLKESYGME